MFGKPKAARAGADTGGKGLDVVISHAPADRAAAEAICAALERAGRRCWIAHRDAAATAPRAALERARLLLVLLSPAAEQVPEILDDVTEARALGLLVVAVKLADWPQAARLEALVDAAERIEVTGGLVQRHLSALVVRIAARLGETFAVDLGPGETPSRPAARLGEEATRRVPRRSIRDRILGADEPSGAPPTREPMTGAPAAAPPAAAPPAEATDRVSATRPARRRSLRDRFLARQDDSDDVPATQLEAPPTMVGGAPAPPKRGQSPADDAATGPRRPSPAPSPPVAAAASPPFGMAGRPRSSTEPACAAPGYAPSRTARTRRTLGAPAATEAELPPVLASRRSARAATKRGAGAEEPVDCSAFSPAAIARDAAIIVQVFVHRPEAGDAVATAAAAADPDAARRGVASLGLDVAPGSRIALSLVVAGLHVVDTDPAEIVWRGRAQSVQFLVTAPADAAPGPKVATVRAAVDGVPAGLIRFVIEVKAAARGEAEPVGDYARRYAKAYVCYATPDRAEVLKRVQMLQRVGIQCFQDVLDLAPGQRWEAALYRHIDASDLFLLFWSTNARDSEWVRKEVIYALERQAADPRREPEIVPVLLEGPPPVAPPPELAHLHFNDPILYFMANSAQVTAQQPR